MSVVAAHRGVVLEVARMLRAAHPFRVLGLEPAEVERTRRSVVRAGTRALGLRALRRPDAGLEWQVASRARRLRLEYARMAQERRRAC